MAIERLEGIEGEVLDSNAEPDLRDYVVAEPMFLIGFDADQAKHFEESWICEPEALINCGYEFVARR